MADNTIVTSVPARSTDDRQVQFCVAAYPDRYDGIVIEIDDRMDQIIDVEIPRDKIARLYKGFIKACEAIGVDPTDLR